MKRRQRAEEELKAAIDEHAEAALDAAGLPVKTGELCWVPSDNYVGGHLAVLDAVGVNEVGDQGRFSFLVRDVFLDRTAKAYSSAYSTDRVVPLSEAIELLQGWAAHMPSWGDEDAG